MGDFEEYTPTECCIFVGVVGARNVKWLACIEAHKDEHPGLWQQRYYKGFPPCVDWNTVNFSSAPSIQEVGIASVCR